VDFIVWERGNPPQRKSKEDLRQPQLYGSWTFLRLPLAVLQRQNCTLRVIGCMS